MRADDISGKVPAPERQPGWKQRLSTRSQQCLQCGNHVRSVSTGWRRAFRSRSWRSERRPPPQLIWCLGFLHKFHIEAASPAWKFPVYRVSFWSHPRPLTSLRLKTACAPDRRGFQPISWGCFTKETWRAIVMLQCCSHMFGFSLSSAWFHLMTVTVQKAANLLFLDLSAVSQAGQTQHLLVCFQ